MTRLDKVIAEHLFNHLQKDERFRSLKKVILKECSSKLAEENVRLNEEVKILKGKVKQSYKLLDWINRYYAGTPLSMQANKILKDE